MGVFCLLCFFECEVKLWGEECGGVFGFFFRIGWCVILVFWWEGCKFMLVKCWVVVVGRRLCWGCLWEYLVIVKCCFVVEGGGVRIGYSLGYRVVLLWLVDLKDEFRLFSLVLECR